MLVDAEALVETIDAVAEVVEVLPDIRVTSDPGGNSVIATAIATRADLIVTGDKSHLLALESVDGIPIVTPRMAIERLGI